MKTCSQKRFDNMVVPLTESLMNKSSESRRKCFYWATSQLLSEYKIIKTKKELKEEAKNSLTKM